MAQSRSDAGEQDLGAERVVEIVLMLCPSGISKCYLNASTVKLYLKETHLIKPTGC